MDVRQLRDFTAVADCGTVTAAAESLHLSQPPLTAQIHLLEEELGCRLFDRTARRMELTEAGRLLYDRACAILTLCSSTQSEMADFLSGGTGTLRMGIASSIIGTQFLTWLKEFRLQNPGVRFELREANTYQLLDAVRSGQTELALVRRPFSAADLDCIPLQNDPLCAVGLPSFLPDAPDIPLQSLAGQPLLLYRRWETILRDAFREQQLHPLFLCVADDARTVVRMAEEGLGVGIVPGSVLSGGGSLAAQPLREPILSSEICAVSRRNVYLTAAARQFLALLREHKNSKK
jgi:DNA-binding transcriptional LysR family regulator